MKIALIGYGKMGKTIEEIAISKGHEIILKIDLDNTHLMDTELKNADIAIEFTSPQSVVENLKKCFDIGIPVVCGSTGWLEKWEEVKDYCLQKNGTLLYASNFSIGVNIFFELNKLLAEMMATLTDYTISIEETHHTQKKDAPSGTAITIAEGVMEKINRLKKWVNHSSNCPEELQVISKRIDPAPGTHVVKYESEVDSIEIIHTAHNRKGFASGAVLAAEFIFGKKGIYNMNDIIN